jgi:hypothetical protein
MATTTKKQTARGRAQDGARVAGGQKHEVQYEAEKTGKPAAAVKKAVKSPAIVARRSSASCRRRGPGHPGRG